MNLELTISEPIELLVGYSSPVTIGSSQAGPQGIQGEQGEGIGDHETTYDHDEFVSSSEIDIIKKLSQAEYDALGAYSATTMYVIVG